MRVHSWDRYGRRGRRTRLKEGHRVRVYNARMAGGFWYTLKETV